MHPTSATTTTAAAVFSSDDTFAFYHMRATHYQAITHTLERSGRWETATLPCGKAGIWRSTGKPALERIISSLQSIPHFSVPFSYDTPYGENQHYTSVLEGKTFTHHNRAPRVEMIMGSGFVILIFRANNCTGIEMELNNVKMGME